jgi:hypothetical protein
MSATKIDSLQLQERDRALLRGLFESRIMTAEHIATLYFDGKREYTKKRLQKLKAAGLISQRRRRVNEPAILFLTRKAFVLLKNEGQLSKYPPLSADSFEKRANLSEFTLRHELEIMDVKAAFHAALAKSENFSLLEFCTWPALYQFEVSRPGQGTDTVVKPDGYIHIHEKEAAGNGFAHDCFLEVDRSSKDQGRLISQAICYRDHYRTGGFAVSKGAPRTDFESFPFRVLIILKSAERRNNTAERLLQNTPPILTMVWLATLADVIADPLGYVWIRPSDYRDVTNGTPFSSDRVNRDSIYRHQVARDLLVEAKIRKHRLLGE